MRTTFRRLLLPIAVAVSLAFGIGISALGVSVFMWAPGVVVLVVAAIAVIFNVRSPKALASFGLLTVVGMGFGFLIVALLSLLLRHMPVWGVWLFVLAVVAFEVERYRNRKRKRHA
jgi:type III secretory pathway component EscU